MNVNATNEDMLSVSELKSTTGEREREKGMGGERKKREREKKKGKLILMNAFGEDTLMQSPVPLIITAKGGLHILFSDGYLGFH